MEYIGKTKKDGRDISFYSGHLNSGNIKKIKGVLKILSVVVLIVGILIFPFEIGSAIGYWVSEFVGGIKSHF